MCNLSDELSQVIHGDIAGEITVCIRQSRCIEIHTVVADVTFQLDSILFFDEPSSLCKIDVIDGNTRRMPLA